MLETIGVAGHLAEPGCPIWRIAVADGLKPGGLHFDPDDGEPLGFMHENRNLRAALHARADAGKDVWLLWKSRVASVDRGDHGVVVALEDGRKLARAAADCRRWPQFEDARSSRDQRRAVEVRPSGDRLGASARTAARACRVRDLLSDGAVRAAADERRQGRPPLGDSLVGARRRCGRLALPERRGFRCGGGGGDGRLPWQGRDARAALLVSARFPSCGADHGQAARTGRRCRPCDPPDRGPGPQPRLP